MKNAHYRTWIMVKNLKNVKNETHILEYREYGEKTEKCEKLHTHTQCRYGNLGRNNEKREK
jgi:hypothetical protein